ncbi:hypothetical protein GCM10027440_21260 [Nocardiopsis coralliicola]
MARPFRALGARSGAGAARPRARSATLQVPGRPRISEADALELPELRTHAPGPSPVHGSVPAPAAPARTAGKDAAVRDRKGTGPRQRGRCGGRKARGATAQAPGRRAEPAGFGRVPAGAGQLGGRARMPAAPPAAPQQQRCFRRAGAPRAECTGADRRGRGKGARRPVPCR